MTGTNSGSPSAPLIVDPTEFMRRCVAATLATAKGESPPFQIIMRPGRFGVLSVLDDGCGPVGATLPSTRLDFGPLTGEMDREACVHALAAWLDGLWRELQAGYVAGVWLGNDAWFFHLWASVRDALLPWIDARRDLAPSIVAEAEEAFARTIASLFQATLEARPEVVQQRYGAGSLPGLRTGRNTLH